MKILKYIYNTQLFYSGSLGTYVWLTQNILEQIAPSVYFYNVCPQPRSAVDQGCTLGLMSTIISNSKFSQMPSLENLQSANSGWWIKSVKSCELGPFKPFTSSKHLWRAETKKSRDGTRRRPQHRPDFACSQLAPCPLQQCLTSPIWLRLRSSISRKWRTRKRKRKTHCLRKKRMNRRSKQASRNEACAASMHCTFHKHCLLILLLLAV